MNLKAILILSIAGFLTANFASAATEKFYKWTDEKGQVHYGQRPPLNTEIEVIKAKTAQAAPTEPASQGNTEAKPAPKSETKPETKPEQQLAIQDPKICQQAKETAEALKAYARIKIKEGNEYRYLTPEEHAQKLKDAQAAISASCE